jgi:hypothetical protein
MHCKKNSVIGCLEHGKRIHIRKQFAHEITQHGQMKLVRVSTTFQLADLLTKPLHFPQYICPHVGTLLPT